MCPSDRPSRKSRTNHLPPCDHCDTAKRTASTISAAEVNNRGYRLPIENGLVIQRVEPGTTAFNAGLRGLTQAPTGGITLGDIITSIDGEKMDSLDDLYRYLDKKQIGDTAQVELYRGGKSVTVAVKLLGSLPATRTTRKLE